jgi:hypothetical protein
LDFTGLEGFPGNQKKTENLKFETGVTTKPEWFRVAAFLAGPWVKGVAVGERGNGIEF